MLWDSNTDNEKNRLSTITALIQQRKDLTPELVFFEEKLIHKIGSNQPEIFDQINTESNKILEDTFNYIVKKYNSAVDNSENIQSVFERISSIAKSKGIKYDSVFTEIGKNLTMGQAPTIPHIYYASNYISKSANSSLA